MCVSVIGQVSKDSFLKKCLEAKCWIHMLSRGYHPRLRRGITLGYLTWRLSKRFFLGFENMGDMGWAGNALFGPWGGVTWAQLRYAGDGDSQFAWGSHEKAEKCPRV